MSGISKKLFFCYLALDYSSQDSSIGSILASYRGGPGFKSRQGQKIFSENK